MNPILSHPLFAGMVCKHAEKTLGKPKLRCDFCSFTGTDPENFGADLKTCSRCQEYLDCMRIYGMDMEEITKRFSLIGSIRAMENSVGVCAPTGVILTGFKNFFTRLRSIPEIKKAISEGLESERRKKDEESTD